MFSVVIFLYYGDHFLQSVTAHPAGLMEDCVQTGQVCPEETVAMVSVIDLVR